MVSVGLFAAGVLFALVQFIVANVFLKRMDEIVTTVKELSKDLHRQYELFVLKENHYRDLDELKKRIEKVEEKSD